MCVCVCARLCVCVCVCVCVKEEGWGIKILKSITEASKFSTIVVMQNTQTGK